jgi:hypothetical protein
MFVTSESLVSHATVLVSSALCYIFRGTHLMLTGTLFRTGVHVRSLHAWCFQLNLRKHVQPQKRRGRPTGSMNGRPVQLKKKKSGPYRQKRGRGWLQHRGRVGRKQEWLTVPTQRPTVAGLKKFGPAILDCVFKARSGKQFN